MSFGSISYNAIGSCESVSSDRIHNQTIYSCSKKQDETSQREKQKRVHIFEEITIEWIWAIKEWINEVGKGGKRKNVEGDYDKDITL